MFLLQELSDVGMCGCFVWILCEHQVLDLDNLSNLKVIDYTVMENHQE